MGPLSTSNDTFKSQPTYVLPLKTQEAETKYMYMGDRWNYPDLVDASYVWLPIELSHPYVSFREKYSGFKLLHDPNSSTEWDLDSFLNIQPKSSSPNIDTLLKSNQKNQRGHEDDDEINNDSERIEVSL